MTSGSFRHSKFHYTLLRDRMNLARSNPLNFAGELPFQQSCQRFARRNIELLSDLIYREFNDFGRLWASARQAVVDSELLQDIDRRLNELCPISQQRVRATVTSADDGAGHGHHVTALFGR